MLEFLSQQEVSKSNTVQHSKKNKLKELSTVEKYPKIMISRRLITTTQYSSWPSSFRCFSTTTSSKTTSNNNTQKYTLAIARRVPESFNCAITKFAETTSGIDLVKARKQHDDYLEKLRKFVPTICLPSIDSLPDSVFVEDTVITVNNNAVITNPGHASRRKEVDSMKEFLSKQLGMNVTDMRDSNKRGQEQQRKAHCDGGDVLYTSRHLFVGISERTNAESARILEDALGITAILVPFEGNALHLKSIVTHVDDRTLLAPEGALGDHVLEIMDAKNLGYDIIRLPRMLACNVVSVNQGLLAQDVGCQKSKEILQAVASERDLDIEFLSFSEYAKADGALTCCSVLLNI